MKQAFLSRPGERLAFREVPIPRPAAADVLIKISVSTICTMTDLQIMAGLHPPHDSAVEGMLPHDLRLSLNRQREQPLRDQYPLHTFDGLAFPAAMGHEAAGTIVDLGPDANLSSLLVFPDQQLRRGDRVATFKVRGAYGEYASLPSSNVVKLPPSMTDDEGSLFEPLVINYNCLHRCFSIRPPRSVAVLGQGCQGLLATQIVRALGARQVIVTEPLVHKRVLALELGADTAIDPYAVNTVHEIERLTGGRGVDLVVECVGAEETVRLLPYLVRRGGMIAQIGAITRPVTFDYGYVHFKHFMVVPSDYVRTLKEVADQVADVLTLVQQQKIQLRKLITHRFDFAAINEAFDLLRDHSGSAVKVAVDIGEITGT